MVINPADSLYPLSDFSNRLHSRIDESTRTPCCTYVFYFPNDDKPAFSAFSILISNPSEMRTFYRNLLRFLGKPVEVV